MKKINPYVYPLLFDNNHSPLYKKGPCSLDLEVVLVKIARIFGVTLEEIREKDRKAPLPEVRRLWAFVSTEVFKIKVLYAGALINRDHSTILYGSKRVKELLEIKDENTIRALKMIIPENRQMVINKWLKS